ncbi:MAG: polysaccharide pyruvyl transferase family protein [Candidatus Cryptobacteroides sp.]
MKIGLLSYHAACNFGAFLQLLSTVEYFKKHGDTPVVINWVPEDFRKDYEECSKPDIIELYSGLRREYYPMTALCRTSREVAEAIDKEGIEAVVIGSDAVLQHHSLLGRLSLSRKRIVSIDKRTSDRLFPNCFWGSFRTRPSKAVPMALMSVSSQDSKYYLFGCKTKKRMEEALLGFSYISVRDEWTRAMVSNLTGGEIVPPVTPDPVFAFNRNAGHLIPSREEILKRFGLPEDYMILSFKNGKSVNQAWLDKFQEIAEADGLSCVRLPYPDCPGFGSIRYRTDDVLSPLDWYAIIKYSQAYIGNNMHPIVTSIANGVPFFSFDHYGIVHRFDKRKNGESSKIYHLLNMAGLLSNRVHIKSPGYVPPSPESVYEAVRNMDREKEAAFASNYLRKYDEMMAAISSVLVSGGR